MTTLNIDKRISRLKNRAEIVELKRLKKRFIKMLEDLGENFIDIDCQKTRQKRTRNLFHTLSRNKNSVSHNEDNLSKNLMKNMEIRTRKK